MTSLVCAPHRVDQNVITHSFFNYIKCMITILGQGIWSRVATHRDRQYQGLHG